MSTVERVMNAYIVKRKTQKLTISKHPDDSTNILQGGGIHCDLSCCSEFVFALSGCKLGHENNCNKSAETQLMHATRRRNYRWVDEHVHTCTLWSGLKMGGSLVGGGSRAIVPAMPSTVSTQQKPIVIQRNLHYHDASCPSQTDR